jgi:hypothetical protein
LAVFYSISDFCISQETAHQERAGALKEQEAASMADLENKALEYAKHATEQERIYAKEEKEETIQYQNRRRCQSSA